MYMFIDDISVDVTNGKAYMNNFNVNVARKSPEGRGGGEHLCSSFYCLFIEDRRK